MDNIKLNYLAGRAMGWELVDTEMGEYWMMPDIDNKGTQVCDWSPCTCADDALILLEKIAGNEGIMLHKLKKRYGNWVCWLKSGANCRAFYEAKSAPLAMTLCALRAAGIPESEITAAME